MKNHSLVNYISSCEAFARDTADWGELDEYKFYTSDGTGGWYESPDCDRGGISVRWAFHENADYIKENAPHEFVNSLLEAVRQCVDEGFDESQWDVLLDEYD